jgi:transcription initiation factor TFIIIB Brf1 subunit/transcription initiation factor TFIIB
MENLNMSVKGIDYTSRVQNAGNTLGFTQPRIMYAINVLKAIKKKKNYIKLSHIGCALYISGKSLIEGVLDDKNQKEIAFATNMTENSIRYAMRQDIKSYWKECCKYNDDVKKKIYQINFFHN